MLRIYTTILLKSVCLSQLANCRSQFLLARLGRYLKLFVSTESTSCHEFASQFGLDFFIREKHSKPRGNRAASASVYLNGQRPAIVASGAGCVGCQRHVPTPARVVWNLQPRTARPQVSCKVYTAFGEGRFTISSIPCFLVAMLHKCCTLKKL